MQHIPLDIVCLSIIIGAPGVISLAFRVQYPKVLKAQSSQAISIVSRFRCGTFIREPVTIRRKQEFRGDGAVAAPLRYGKHVSRELTALDWRIYD